MGQTHQRESAIFDAAIELPPEQRAAHLDHACGGDAALRQRMESLLKACESACEFLDSPTVPAAAQTINVLPASFEKAGDRIGRYKLLQQIGEGGCGVVYMAEQEEPVSRRVALKVIKLGLDTKSVIARFEAERQALALMDHPNIAKVLDAGATETGRPYFVMELVRGRKITDYCDEARLSTHARLDLFIQVCQAIQHAHQKGIIHRDIKPSNILVTINDGVPVPKVIDFGIAKATGGLKLTNKTLFTAFEQFIGTPAYMSPEQAVLTSLDIDTRSDIYALGVLLYEMLTGKTPFDAQELLAIGLDEMRRTIRETEPPRPSTRVSTLPGDEAGTTAQRRGIEAPKLVSELRGDLDWIVMKALEKDRSRRYETANGLAMDIQRHLNNEPVVACPPSRLYRLQKTMRRNRLAFSAVTAVAIALITGVIVSVWQAQRAKAERDSAEAVLKFFRERILAAGRPEGQDGGLGKDVTLRNAIDEAEPQITASFENRPAVEAAIRHTLGESYAYLGEGARAIEQLKRALALRRQNLGPEHAETLKTMSNLGRVYADAGNAEEAVALLEQVLKVRQRKSGPKDPDTIRSMNDLVGAHMRAGSQNEAVALGEKALDISRARLGPENEITLSLLNDLSVAYLYLGKKDKALPLLEKVLEVKKTTRGPADLETIGVMHNLGQAYLQARKPNEAILLYEEAFKHAMAKIGVGHRNTRSTLHWLTVAFKDTGQLKKAVSVNEETLNLTKAKPGLEGHTATIMARLAGLRAQMGEFAEAAAELARAREIDPENHEVWHDLAALLVATGQVETYREHCRRSIEKFGNSTDPKTAERIAQNCLILPESGADLDAVARLANTAAAVTNSKSLPRYQLVKGLAEYRQRRFAEAIECITKILPHEGQSKERDVEAYMVLAMAHYQLKQFDEARAALGRGDEVAQANLPKLESGNIGGSWIDWVIAHALMREAKELIESRTDARE